MNSVLHLLAPAKVNLVLRVLARRPNGYHELETWMQKIDLYDEVRLEVKEGAEIELLCDDENLPAGRENLAWKAAATFLDNSKVKGKCGVSIHLKKNIPVAAGLGGGSSDAGTVLKGLNTIFHNEFSLKELITMGVSLGADVPLFVTDYGAVLARGIGEIMVPVPSLANITFLLVNGGYPVSTKWVFEKFALTRIDKDYKLRGSHESFSESLGIADISNDLERVTMERYPEIADVKKQLLAAGAQKALMSGSGPTVFGVFPDREKKQQKLDEVAVTLRQEYGAQVFITRSCAGV